MLIVVLCDPRSSLWVGVLADHRKRLANAIRMSGVQPLHYQSIGYAAADRFG